uniref:Lipase_3 domain-containing protein n=1 Tax=Rhabditophanes sp. KR3021 TaxID=114890 RepID=A0AC35UC31_9BILA
MLLLSLATLLTYLSTAINAAQYDETLSFKAYMLTAAAYTDNNLNMIQTCVDKAYPSANSIKYSQISGSSYDCDVINSDKCTGIYVTLESYNTTIIAFRGTEKFDQYLEQLKASFQNPQDYTESGVAHGKISSYYLRAGDMTYDNFLSASIAANPLQQNIIITGHSLGGALAIMTGLNLLKRNLVLPDNLKVITFGEPRIGDYEFAQYVQSRLNYLFRVVHYHDIIPHFPACTSNGNGCKEIPSEPYHHSTEIWYGSEKTMKKGEYQVCDTNNGEDPNCSDKDTDVGNTLGALFQNQHMEYFGDDIQKFGERGCKSSASQMFSLLFLAITMCQLLYKYL